LLSDNAYTLEVVYAYDLNDGEGAQTLTVTETFTTVAKAAPTGSISNPVSDQESIGFDYAITDTDTVITDIEYVFAGTSMDITGTLSDTLSENGLNSNTDYIATITVTYNLNDGEGAQTLTLSETFTTEAKTTATASADAISVTPGVIDIDLLVSDEDSTIVSSSLEAVIKDESGNVLQSFSPSTGLQVLSHYAFIYGETLDFEVTADINLNDGTTQQTVTLLTTTIDVPEFVLLDISDGDITEDSFKGSLDLSALEGTIDFTTIETVITYPDYDDEILADAFISNTSIAYNVDGLLADREVKVSVHADYDVGNGTESGTVYEITLKTTANEAPTGELDITDFDKNAGEITFDLDMSDPDNVRNDGLYATVKLYRENASGAMELYKTKEISQDPGTTEFTFDSLDLEYREFYLIEVETSYYLRDARGTHDSVVLDLDTVRINVTPDAPSATISATTRAKGEVTFDVAIIDNHETIEDGTLYARLLQGGSEVKRVLLSSLNETVTFNELMNDTAYTLDVVADVDLKEATIRNEEVLTTSSFNSLDVAPTAFIDSITRAKGEATVDYTVTDPYDTLVDSEFYAVLYESGVEVERIALANLVGSATFTELTNATAYTVELESDLNFEEPTIRENVLLKDDAFTSLDVTPSTGTSITTAKGEVTVDVSITDPYLTVDIQSLDAVLYEAGVEVDRLTLDSLSDSVTFTQISSDMTYTVKIESNLDYGEAAIRENQVLDETVFQSLDVSPNIDYVIDNTTVSRIDITLNEADPYNVFTGVNRFIEVFDESGALINTFSEVSDETEISLTNLLSDHEYRFVYSAAVDYSDGSGTLTRELHSETISTDAYSEPSASINGINPGEEDVDFSLSLSDPDSLGATLDSVVLNLSGSEADRIDAPSQGSHTFSTLYSDTAYALVLTYSYDMQDGNGVQTVSVEETFTTLAYTEPDVNISENTLDETSINFDVTLTDPDGKLSSLESIELYMDGTLQDSIEPPNFGSHSFTGLLSDTAYTIKATYTYELNNNEGTVTSTSEYAFQTDAYSEPSLSITTSAISEETADVTVSLSDPDSRATLEEYVLESSLGVEDTKSTSIEGVTNYTTLYSNETYTVRVTYTYDLNNNEGPQTVEETHTFTTEAYSKPSAELTNLDFVGSDLSVDVSTLVDPDGRVTTLNLVLYVDGVQAQTLTAITANTTQTFTDVYEVDKEFTVVLTADYDLNESSGVYVDAIFDQSKITAISQ